MERIKINDLSEEQWVKLLRKTKEEKKDAYLTFDEEESSFKSVLPSEGFLKSLAPSGILNVEENTKEPVEIDLQATSNVLKRKIREILRDNTAKRPSLPSDYGTLRHDKLWKYRTNPRIFSRKDKETKKDYAIMLLVDTSGSMSYRDEGNVAPKIAGQLILDFQDYCQIAVMGFNRYLTEHKKFEVKMNKEEIKEEMAKLGMMKHNSGRSCNHDWYAIEKGASMLQKNGAKKQILIVISDGLPECSDGCREKGRSTREQFDTKKAIDKAQAAGIVTLGIGIDTESVKEFYQIWKVVHDPKEIYEAILPILKKQIVKHSQ